MADSPRKKWGHTEDAIFVDKVSAAKQLEPKQGYDEYLSLLHHKNKFVQEMKTKSKQKIELERREHGFSVYVNGPHQKPPKTSTRPPKTATDSWRSKSTVGMIPEIEESSYRAKTAPRKTPRKNWGVEALQIQSQAGEKVSLDVPEDLSGHYEDDFTSDSEFDDVAKSNEGYSKNMGVGSGEACNDGLLNIHSDKLIMSISDVMTLRKSLQFNKTLSIDFESDSETDSIEEIITGTDDLSLDAEVVFDFSEMAERSQSVPAYGSSAQINALPKRPGTNEINMRMDSTKAGLPRPLSAVNKIVEDVHVPSENEKMKIMQALQEENKYLQPKLENTTGNLKQIEERVSQMGEFQQKAFLRTLKKIELSASPKSSIDKHPVPQREISIEVLSNWGHPHLAGLTELQAFGDTGQKLLWSSSSITVTNAAPVDTDLSVLCNNRFKTTKERNMMLFQLMPEKQDHFVITFKVPASVVSLKIWNYNKSLGTLNIGIKDVSVYLDQELIFEGEIEKGCGNQVFDYSTVIPLTSNDSTITELYGSNEKQEGSTPMDAVCTETPLSDINAPSFECDQHNFQGVELGQSERFPARCETRLVNLPDHELDRPEIPAPCDRPEATAPCAVTSFAQPPRSLPPSGARAFGDSEASNNPILSKKSSPMYKSHREKATVVLKSTGKPDWLAQTRKERSASPSWLPPKAEESRFSNLEVADDKEEERWRLRASSRQESFGEIPDPPKVTHKLPKRPRTDLEQSWSSLSLFDRSQKGRISMDLEELLELLPGDILDSYISSDKAAKEEVAAKLEVLDEEEDESEPGFIIPELPAGKVLDIEILSTWGDKFYVGLNGIEVFSSSGQPVTVGKISAHPADINVLTQFSGDPRVITNVLDGVNKTRDDTHMWLAPFTQGQVNRINIVFQQRCNIAMIRVWNYNKSRIHSYRGVKDVVIYLDKKCIFKGEIERACGGVMGGTEVFGDTILFTTDERILEAVSGFDETFEGQGFGDGDVPDVDVPLPRPSTADKDQIRPFTSTAKNRMKATIEPEIKDGNVCVYTITELKVIFMATWGDPHYFGLTGLEVVGSDWEAVPLSLDMLKACPPDLHILPGHEQDDRTLDKLIDGVNLTTADTHMWLAPFTEGESHTLRISFKAPTQVVGLRVWNYNKSPEDTYRGVQYLRVLVDSTDISPEEGFLVRKGMGICFFDFVQEITFKSSKILRSSQKSQRPAPNIQSSEGTDYESPSMPTGFIYQLQLTSSCGDLYYIGLNGLEFYDETGKMISLKENDIAAYPDSVNVLDNVSGDPRTPDKLIDGINSTKDGAHMWLAPILPGEINRVFVIFDAPTTISMIKLWNYGKTPERGVKDFGLLVDDLLVYNGQLEPVSTAAQGILPTCDVPQQFYTMLFNGNLLPRHEKHTVISNKSEEQDFQMTNDSTVVARAAHSKSGQKVDQALRPTTSVVKPKRKK